MTTGLDKSDTRSTLLWWLHTTLMIVMVAIFILVFLDNPAGSWERKVYAILVGVLFLLLGAAFAFLAGGKYLVSAAITVAIPIMGAWGSFIFDPSIIHGDIFPLFYIVFSIMLSSILLSQVVTVSLSIIQFSLLIVIFLTCPDLRPYNWASFLTFILVTAILSITTGRLIGERIEVLRKFAVTDNLTGLFNRRYFEITLDHKLMDRRLDSDEGADHVFGTILLDLDRFKGLNDTFGHGAGDAVLRDFAQLLTKTIPLDAVGCRYGGDEFAIITHTLSKDGIVDVAEKLRDRVAHTDFTYEGRDIGPVTITLGVAWYPEQGRTRTALLAHADENLLRAKRAGRNQVGTG